MGDRYDITASEFSRLIRGIGRIEGRLTGIDHRLNTHSDLLTSIDGRVRTVETQARVNGAVTGGTVAVGISIIVETVRQLIK